MADDVDTHDSTLNELSALSWIVFGCVTKIFKVSLFGDPVCKKSLWKGRVLKTKYKITQGIRNLEAKQRRNQQAEIQKYYSYFFTFW